jgi:hypothetical protein
MDHVRAPLVTTLAMLLLAGSAAAQEPRPDFSGRWRLDPDAMAVSGGGTGDARGDASGGGGRGGGGIGLGPPAGELVITQNDSTIRIEAVRDGGTAAVLEYRPGRRTINAMPVGRGATADVTYAARWDGDRLETTITRAIAARGSVTEVRYREVLRLASDSVLVVETTVLGRPGGRRASYLKTR